ncbi:MAG: DUF5050 domain-containing protein [Bacteroidota bacterium]
MSAQSPKLQSTLEIYDITDGSRTIVLQEEAHFEAPNWSRDGSYLLINRQGLLFKVDLESRQIRLIDTDFADRLNNDHGISPDGKQLVISHHDSTVQPGSRNSRIYVLPVAGGSPKVVTSLTPSYWHGWSPDGQTLAYVGMRDGEYDIYTISVEGGEETKLTDAPGLDDGPDYSPDGKYIYYNSMASGKMELWRMKADGSEKKQLTNDAFSNWFPHPSPDGKYLVYIAYLEDQGSAHPPMKAVALKLYDLEAQSSKILCAFTGGQGTINVPSWSPDGKKFAFVSYRALP